MNGQAENQSPPCVSVILPAFNLASYIEDAARSVLTQSFSDLELIIVNDCSTDLTHELAEDFARRDKRVKVFRTAKNVGGAGARNLGLQRAGGRYVAFIDGDDLWAPEKLKMQLELMEKTGATLSYTALLKVDENGTRFGAVQQVPQTISYHQLLGNPIIGCSTVVLDYEALGRPLMPHMRKRQDFAFWLMLLRSGARAVGINEPLTFYRVRPGSLSANKASAAWHVWRVYRELERLPLRTAIPKFLSYAARGYLKRLNR